MEIRKNLGTIAEVILAVVIFLSVMWIIHEVRAYKKKEANYQAILKEKDAIISYRENKEGKLIAEKDAAVGSYKQLAEAYPLIAESIQKDFDIKLKNLKAYMQAEFEAGGSGMSHITNNYYIDSAGNKIDYFVLKANDGYLDFSSNVYSPTNAPYTYTYTDSIKVAFNVKKKWLLGKETLYGSTMLSNPGAKVTNSTSFMVNEAKDKRFYLGAGMSYGIDGRFVPSVHIGYALIKF